MLRCMVNVSNHGQMDDPWPTHFTVHGWTSAFLLAVHRLCSVIEGRLSHFLPRWLRAGWQSAIGQRKIPWNTPPWLGIGPGPRGGQTVSYPTELSWLTFILLTMGISHGTRQNGHNGWGQCINVMQGGRSQYHPDRVIATYMRKSSHSSVWNCLADLKNP